MLYYKAIVVPVSMIDVKHFMDTRKIKRLQQSGFPRSEVLRELDYRTGRNCAKVSLDALNCSCTSSMAKPEQMFVNQISEKTHPRLG